MTTCFGKMLIEDEHELGPQLKKMKLSSEGSQAYEICRANLMGVNLQTELKMTFPYITEEVEFILKFRK
jgi:hypothetical protein